MLSLGEIAPDFTLADQDGKNHMLSDYRGRWVLLYFYPKDNTPGCTKEACMIRDAFPRFEGVHARVFGISVDSVKSHKKFADEYQLPFSLLADEQKEVVGKYGVWGEKKMMGRTYMGTKRTSFLIDPNGVIKKIYENVKPEVHAEEVLADLQSFNA
ncbi:thioredoxin-dependent thiol peroxidase [Patescibacteria group bacterium]|nr:MAG: thioredoxin-dependent thiol peroxidase [Patescibacteria group bacterium]